MMVGGEQRGGACAGRQRQTGAHLHSTLNHHLPLHPPPPLALLTVSDSTHHVDQLPPSSHPRLQEALDGPPGWHLGQSVPRQHHAMERSHIWPSGHTVRGWDVQTAAHVRRVVPEQAANSEVPVADVPPECVRERGAVPGHPAEPVVTDVRRRGDPDEHPVAAARPEPKQPGECGGCAAVPGEHEGVRAESAGDGGGQLAGSR